MGCKPELSTLGQYDSFRLMLVTGWYFTLQSSYSGPSASSLLTSSLEPLFHDAMQHFFMIQLEFYDMLELLPFHLISVFGKKMSQRARSGEWRAWGTTTTLFTVKNYGTDKSTWASMLLPW
jgi:hypothetical protein